MTSNVTQRTEPWFGHQLDQEAIDDTRLALNQNQPLGNNPFYAKLEKLTGERREAKPETGFAALIDFQRLDVRRRWLKRIETLVPQMLNKVEQQGGIALPI